jgi:hypothetical protein
MLRGAFAGAVAASLWAGAEPALGKLFGTTYSDRRLLQGLAGITPARALVLHACNGAVFGATFERLGLRGPLRGMVAAQTENLVLWPGMLVAERVHPSCRDGEWPALFRSRRIFAYEVAGHALFGALLGSMLPQLPGE